MKSFRIDYVGLDVTIYIYILGTCCTLTLSVNKLVGIYLGIFGKHRVILVLSLSNGVMSITL